MIAAIAGALDTSLIELTSAVSDELRQAATAPASASMSASMSSTVSVSERGAFTLAA